MRLELRVDPDLPSVHGVRRRLEQAFTNLVVNAIHAAGVREAQAGWVEARVRAEGDEVVVEVVDNGPGIAPEVKERLFEPFFTTKAPEMGTGLGLPITREIIEAHGGRIEVVSERGRGACFRVRLPAVGTAGAGIGSLAKARPRVLVVDDDEGVARALKRVLQSGFEVTVALGGEAAFRLLLEDATWDAMIVDVSMPEVDGPELYARVRARWPGLEKRIVFATGGAYTPASKAFLAAVPNRRFEKPIDGAELRPILRALVDAA